MKAIETYYKGYRFRSRLEARWAVFFDLCQVDFEYEPKEFVLSDGTYYLPDFYLPDLHMYFEVKSAHLAGTDEGNVAYKKMRDLANNQEGIFGGLVFGDPLMEKITDVETMETSMGLNFIYFFDDVGVSRLYFTLDYKDISGKGTRMKLSLRDPLMEMIIENFAVRARQARFEHNERKEVN